MFEPRAVARKRQRAFIGLAGSPLAHVTTAEPTPKRQPLSNADRQRLFRERQAAERAAKAPDKWEAILAEEGLSMERGGHARKGKLVTGGYDSAKVESVNTRLDNGTGLATREGDSGKAKPQGSGIKYDEETGGENGGDEIVFDKWGSARVKQTAATKFQAKLKDGQRDAIVVALVAEAFETIPATKSVVDAEGSLISEGHPEYFKCRVCDWHCEWGRDCHRHIEDIHEQLIEAEAKCRRKRQKSLAVAGKQTLERAGWKRLANGEWVKA